MDFYAHQERARAASRRLVGLFALALLAVVLAVDAAAVVGWALLGGGTRWPPYFFTTNTFVTLLIVFGGAWVELGRLRDGGAALARRLGARALDVAQPAQRRLRDIAEEVAIGAGVPVPALYVLDDESINALAAGERPGVAAVMVTRGALERLGRAELQGVLAHEFAHIVSGDAALNTRLTAALYGLYSLRLAGFRLLTAAVSHDPPGPFGRWGLPRLVWMVAGLLLSAVGLLGVLAAQVLRAGISRQREYLADALAVQITRDRDGLGRALRRIAGEVAAPLRSHYAPLVSHFLLVQPAGLGGWFDTHPSLEQRIRRLYGRRMAPIKPAGAAGGPGGAVGQTGTAGAAAAAGARDAIEGTAEAGGAQALSAARAPLLESLPFESEGPTTIDTALLGPQTVANVSSPASALIAQIRSASLGFETAGRWLVALVAGVPGDEPDATLRLSLHWLVSPAGASLRVPLLELLLARVRGWSAPHRRELLDRCRAAVERDGRVQAAEWIYYTLARHRLQPTVAHPARERRAAVSKAAQSRALAALFSMAAAIGQASARNTRDALADAAALLDVPPPAATPDEVGSVELGLALEALLALPPLRKPILLRVLQSLARTPGEPNFEAFVRAVAAAIDCPVPRSVVDLPDVRSDAPEPVY